MNAKKYSSVDTRPVKRFFVDMLTRDIAVEDAILDLLDNCLDGVLRSMSSKKDTEKQNNEDINRKEENATPYIGYWAKINITDEKFEIEDNCGGIPWDEHDRAFRMGRPANLQEQEENETRLTVGVYGIGMKRAIFKIGNEALIWTQNNNDNYQIDISSDWMSTEDLWELEVQPSEPVMEQDGTYIRVTGLHLGIRERFAAESFKSDVIQKIQSHYAVIIQKGFVVMVNGTKIEPNPIQFRFATKGSDNNEVRPYMFRSYVDNVDVFLAIGLREPIPGIERVLEDQTGVQFSSDYAGWTVICNDRVVLYCNRDELTGWGTARIPRYHTQFIAISGVVEFRGDPRKLPTTTTKRGLDFSSALYQQVLDRMREGLRIFIDFTNRWKAREDEAKAQVSPIPAISYSSLKREVKDLPFAQVKVGLEGEQYKPKLPRPTANSTDVRISFSRERDDIWRLAEKILSDFEDTKEQDIPKRVGEASFEFAYNNIINDRKTDQ